MKKLKYSTIVIISCCAFIGAMAQDAKNDLLLSLGYYNDNAQVQYVVAHAKTKIDGRFQPVPGIHLKFFIAAETPATTMGTGITNEKGEALLFIPPSAKEEWNKSAKQSFIAVSEANKQFAETKANLDVSKAKLVIDTAEGRKVNVTLYELKDTTWTPVKGVDIKVAIKRLDGDLNVSETPTYTTDSLGVAGADFKRDSMPGNSKGILTLIAKVEDNDNYGNLSIEKEVKWGVAKKYESDFDKRTLFARRGRSPFWLELMAYSIILGVWGVLFYLLIQIRQLKKLGKLEG